METRLKSFTVRCEECDNCQEELYVYATQIVRKYQELTIHCNTCGHMTSATVIEIEPYPWEDDRWRLG